MTTIHIQLQVRGIIADSYNSALLAAWKLLDSTPDTMEILMRLGVENWNDFHTARAAKEANGTYTVTLP